MTLPIDLVLVRHGQSEGNKAKRLSEAGDHTAFSENFRKRHSSSYRLTRLGRKQAEMTGIWLRKNFCQEYGFDRHCTSEAIRAKETGALHGLPGADWFTDPYLTERDWGDLDICPEDERIERFGKSLEMREIEPFFWRPPNGESFMTLCLRIDRALIEEMNVIPDFRYPDNIRLGIAPIYTSYADIHEGVTRMRRVIEERLYEKYPKERLEVT